MPDYRTSYFQTYDGLRLAYKTLGAGRPLVVIPTGPGLAPDYLGDLGGLPELARRSLLFFALRGSAPSDFPEDPATYRCDRMVEDLEMLRVHLGLEQMDLLAHSQSGDLALMYAAAYPERLSRLILLTPVTTAVGLEPTTEQVVAAMQLRKDEPWFQDASSAVIDALSGFDSFENRAHYVPFFYGRWDEKSRAHAQLSEERADAIEAGFIVDGMFTPDKTRAELAKVTAPVLVYGGEWDVLLPPEILAAVVPLFPNAELVLQPGGAHLPWVDDPVWLGNAIARFLMQ
jgi:pimeloyl-ACP methyl ester carboxylesterase